ncbi:efflux RND transporter periplasmic adaptor subunit [Sabulicella glaciei]|uniref:Efflux RND transporter periplasmic adaptor subunit n=1 Tax=Sabulicella glaciei TaxID=2984948 RepID=A0ABT3NPY0_9PROT|nr:efflux RND transporter periplasmic adaptor subunit [Roseococcus sp. MDT2-1-1]MCW8084216.1 efflux RND transporter periplasmic adaptor subunit [Roseococcus sp. MDT2-1-1]
MPDHNLPERTSPAEVQASPAPRRGRAWLWLPVLAVLGVGGWWGWTHRPAEAPPPAAIAAAPAALTVAVRPVERRSLLRPVIGDGSVAAWQELVVGVETGGFRVIEASFEPGDRVRAGQVLVRLDPSVPEALLAQAEAAVAEAEAALRIAEAEQRRAADLARTESVARATLEQRQSVTRQAEARLAAGRARRDEAASRLAQTRIAAPTDGTVSRRSVLLGAVVQPGQEMFRLIRDDRLELEARVPELELARVEPGQEVRVLHGEREIAGRVRAIFPTVEGTTRLGIVHVVLPPEAGLRVGQFARAEIGAGSAPALVVPQEAVVFRGGQAVAFVLSEDGEKAMQRTVATGQRREGLVEVTQGLREGDRVVTQGAGFLADEDRVRVAPEPRASQSASAAR